MTESGLTCWIDASAGIAGDMLLGALVDAGARMEFVRAAVDAVAPGMVEVSAEQVVRHGMRATKVHVTPVEHSHDHGHSEGHGHSHELGHSHEDGHAHGHGHSHGGSTPHVHAHEHRAWAEIDDMIRAAELAPGVAELAREVFTRIAVAEGRAHGVDPAEVHFHEVGAWDSIADIVGVAAALVDLGVRDVCFGELAVGSGTIRMAHGELAVPGPAVVELSSGVRVQPGPVATELATPTGVAFLAGARQLDAMPAMTVLASGSGAGTKDFPAHANIVRVVVGRTTSPVRTLPERNLVPIPEPVEGSVPEPVEGTPTTSPDRTIPEPNSTSPEPVEGTPVQELTVLEATVDDLDPRLWPGVLDALLAAGANDAWLTPVLMKKGRPAHLLSVLTADVAATLPVVFTHTSTLGVREYPVRRHTLDRQVREVDVDGHLVRIKLGLLQGRIVNAQPEFVDVAALAHALAIPEKDALLRAHAAASAAGLVPGQDA